MSQQGVSAFWKKMKADQALSAKLTAATKKGDFAKLAVQLGQENGCTFTADELTESIRAEIGAAKGELSDKQLVTVAGGVRHEITREEWERIVAIMIKDAARR